VELAYLRCAPRQYPSFQRVDLARTKGIEAKKNFSEANRGYGQYVWYLGYALRQYCGRKHILWRIYVAEIGRAPGLIPFIV